VSRWSLCRVSFTDKSGNFYKYLDTDDESDAASSSSRPIDRVQILDLDGLPERLPLVECSPECGCGETCANRLTQRGVRWPVSVQRGMSGMGLALVYRGTAMPLPKGAFISLYAGECLTTAQARARWSNPDARPRGQGNYTLTIRSPNEVLHVDPRHVGNVGRFLNHSCDPNCVIHLVRWGGGRVWPRAAIFVRPSTSTSMP
jgi:histone-lysine N-methyltransferase SETMAR